MEKHWIQPAFADGSARAEIAARELYDNCAAAGQLLLLNAITAASTMTVEKPRRNSPSMGNG